MNWFSRNRFSSWTRGEDVVKDVLGGEGDKSLDLVAIVTGSNSGIGKETARVLAEHGAQVIIACRDNQKGQETVEQLRKSTGNSQISMIPLDLASEQSIKEFVEQFLRLEIPLNLLINNAGILALSKYEVNDAGIEKQFAVNHMGHFILTNLLLPKMSETCGGRIVNVSSDMFLLASIDWDHMPQTEKEYGGWSTYSLTKLCNILFTVKLQEIVSDAQYKGLSVFSLHPGIIMHTNIARNITGSFMKMLVAPLFKSMQQGAATTLYCALHEEALENPGGYFVDCHVSKTNKHVNKENADKLWELSLHLCSLKN